jgi:hypothetical protein
MARTDSSQTAPSGEWSGRALGGPTVRAAFGGNQSLPGYHFHLMLKRCHATQAALWCGATQFATRSSLAALVWAHHNPLGAPPGC